MDCQERCSLHGDRLARGRAGSLVGLFSRIKEHRARFEPVCGPQGIAIVVGDIATPWSSHCTSAIADLAMRLAHLGAHIGEVVLVLDLELLRNLFDPGSSIPREPNFDIGRP